MIDSAPESIKNSISKSGGSKILFAVLSKRSWIVQLFSLGGDTLFVVF